MVHVEQSVSFQGICTARASVSTVPMVETSRRLVVLLFAPYAERSVVDNQKLLRVSAARLPWVRLQLSLKLHRTSRFTHNRLYLGPFFLRRVTSSITSSTSVFDMPSRYVGGHWQASRRYQRGRPVSYRQMEDVARRRATSQRSVGTAVLARRA
jgi:hypothetical protein